MSASTITHERVPVRVVRTFQAVLAAWKEVGIRISGVRSLAGTSARMRRQAAAAFNGHDEEDSAAVAKKIEQLTGQLVALQTEFSAIKAAARLLAGDVR